MEHIVVRLPIIKTEMRCQLLDGGRGRHDAKRKDVHALHTRLQAVIGPAVDHLFLKGIRRHAVTATTIRDDDGIETTAVGTEMELEPRRVFLIFQGRHRTGKAEQRVVEWYTPPGITSHQQGFL